MKKLLFILALFTLLSCEKDQIYCYECNKFEYFIYPDDPATYETVTVLYRVCYPQEVYAPELFKIQKEHYGYNIFEARGDTLYRYQIIWKKIDRWKNYNN
jgi:hypothetical protein